MSTPKDLGFDAVGFNSDPPNPEAKTLLKFPYLSYHFNRTGQPTAELQLDEGFTELHTQMAAQILRTARQRYHRPRSIRFVVLLLLHARRAVRLLAFAPDYGDGSGLRQLEQLAETMKPLLIESEALRVEEQELEI